MRLGKGTLHLSFFHTHPAKGARPFPFPHAGLRFPHAHPAKGTRAFSRGIEGFDRKMPVLYQFQFVIALF